jgi:hypothetical protein
MYKNKVKVEIDKMLKGGVIEPIQEYEWIIPMVMQENKKLGKRILCRLKEQVKKHVAETTPQLEEQVQLEDVTGEPDSDPKVEEDVHKETRTSTMT